MIVMLFLGVFFSCGEKEIDSGENQNVEVPHFSSLENEIFGLSCAFSSCHGSGTGGLTLDGIDDYARLVDVESISVSGAILVVPGDSSASYLITKMRGSLGMVGGIMPPGGMDEELILRVERWIDAGAIQD